MNLKQIKEKLVNKAKKVNKVLLATEFKYQSIYEMLNKHDIISIKTINSIEITDYIQKNNISKMINKVKGAEK